jgi:hypothetical protein
MKKIAYQTPEVKVKTLFMESLMQASGVKGGGDINIDYGGVDDEGKKDPTAKDFSSHSVWDD